MEEQLYTGGRMQTQMAWERKEAELASFVPSNGGLIYKVLSTGVGIR